MGWLRYSMLGDLGQQFDINDQKVEIQRLKGDNARKNIANAKITDKHKRLVTKVKSLEKELDQTKLYLISLLKLLSDKGTINSQELKQMIYDIDAADGQVDGKFEGRIELD